MQNEYGISKSVHPHRRYNRKNQHKKIILLCGNSRSWMSRKPDKIVVDEKIEKKLNCKLGFLFCCKNSTFLPFFIKI